MTDQLAPDGLDDADGPDDIAIDEDVEDLDDAIDAIDEYGQDLDDSIDGYDDDDVYDLDDSIDEDDEDDEYDEDAEYDEDLDDSIDRYDQDLEDATDQDDGDEDLEDAIDEDDGDHDLEVATGQDDEDAENAADGDEASDEVQAEADDESVEGSDRATTRRVSRWDRPPEPHDWRFWVGGLGRVLIAMGLLMFGFVAYQLWGTGIETARAQASLESQFDELIAQAAANDVADDAAGSAGDSSSGAAESTEGSSQATGGTAAAGNDDPGEAGATATGETDVEAAGGGLFDAIRTEAARSDGSGGADAPPGTDLSDVAVEQDIPPIVRGEVLAKLEIPRIDQVEYIVPGVSLEDLKRGSGHYPDTPLPGQLGNAAIAGHRTTYGAPFFDVDQLVPGDELITTMANGDRFVYLVTFVEVVSANDYWVVSTQDPNVAELTLTSCHPKYTARDRIIVHSTLDPTQSSNVGVPTFYELEPVEAEPIPGDDPVIADDAASDAADDDEAGAGAAAESPDANGVEVIDGPSESGRVPVPAGEGNAGGDGVADGAGGVVQQTDAATTARTPTGPGASPGDAFSQGWFEDPAAFGQIALWGAALAIITLLAYRVARHFRDYSAGILVGMVPFLIALYFFYQNVNRLLPPGI